jgi:hypothetical protein
MSIVDLEVAVTVLDRIKSKGSLYWAVSGPVRLDGCDAMRTLSSAG